MSAFVSTTVRHPRRSSSNSRTSPTHSSSTRLHKGFGGKPHAGRMCPLYSRCIRVDAAPLTVGTALCRQAAETVERDDAGTRREGNGMRIAFVNE